MTTRSIAPERISGDLQRLLARVGLRDEQRVDVDAELLCVLGVERVLSVDERRDAASGLGVRDRVKRQRRLTRRLRAVDLDDAASREAADAERDIEGDGARGDDVDRGAFFAAQAHDGSLAELAVDLGEGCFEDLLAVCCCCHGGLLLRSCTAAQRLS